ncbi:MAG: hypothetical protein L6Q54_10660 [Leptospiraceae bacterium]|nr:hypothetical protein [Leptospiraceae bacterium]MCK6381689.1 hypothetical protein [Leptospiraceae bacterium]NUM40548.1 hypothetical protein [Leptospiraceae bacterium]
MNQGQDNLWGIPIGKEFTAEALVRDLWDPMTDEVFTPKHFIGLGWGINFYAIAKKFNLL